MFQLALCGVIMRTCYGLTTGHLELMNVLYLVMIVTNTWKSKMDNLPRRHVMISTVRNSIHKHGTVKTDRLNVSSVTVGYLPTLLTNNKIVNNYIYVHSLHGHRQCFH